MEPGALACVPVWGDGVQIDAYELDGGEGAARHLVVAHTHDGTGGEATRTAVLDGGLRVLLGDLGDGRIAYTPAEYAYLTGARFENALLARAAFTAADGSGRTLLCGRAFSPTASTSRS